MLLSKSINCSLLFDVFVFRGYHLFLGLTDHVAIFFYLPGNYVVNFLLIPFADFSFWPIRFRGLVSMNLLLLKHFELFLNNSIALPHYFPVVFIFF